MGPEIPALTVRQEGPEMEDHWITLHPWVAARSIRDEHGCLIWTGARGGARRNYGSISPRYGYRSAHRYAYALHYGPIPAGLVIDHVCRNTLCVHPLHLEAVTQSVNLYRGVGVGKHGGKKTHCRRGHPFDDANTYHHNGGRFCRACHCENVRRYNARKAGAR